MNERRQHEVRMRLARWAATALGLWVLAAGCDQASPDSVDASPQAGVQADGAGGRGGAGGAGGGGGGSVDGGNADGSGGTGAAPPDAGGAGGDAAVDEALGCEGEGLWDDVDVVEQLYPLVAGSRWVYRHSGGSQTWDEEVTARASDDAIVLADTPGPSGTRSESRLRVGGGAVCRVYKEVFLGDTRVSSAEYDPGFTRFARAWSHAELGVPEALTYRRREYDSRGVLVRDGDRTHEFTVEARDETVSVPAGEFSGCERIFRDRIRDAGEPEMEDEDKRFWFCPGVGKVREEDATGTRIEELIECEVPGGAC